MPLRPDIRKVLIVGSGPIVIGQACEFDYSGTQGAKSLKQEGLEVVLVNSNPATVMTDPEFADRTYIEPLEPDILEAILERERPDALLPTLGGQTALNLAVALSKNGTLDRLGVELIGASIEAIAKAEDRQQFNAAMARAGLSVARSRIAHSLEEATAAIMEIGFPLILRPSFTLGGSGGGIVYNREEFEPAIRWALRQSPTGECLIEESLLGWKEFELEVIRDCADNFSVICSIENFDPMGVHTGDSITVAPAMTLTDKEYQRLRDAARAVITEIGVDTGGSNIQFAVNPKDGRIIVVEMNPRVSRSSALASKATGYPIAKIAAKLAVGYRLDELTNDITGTSAAFEPSIDYVVVKIPRFAFEKFGGCDQRLTTQMKSVGEVMAIGKTFKQALLKATRSLENGRDGLTSLINKVDYLELARRLRKLRETGEVLSVPIFTEEDTYRSNPEELRVALLEIIHVPLGDRIWYLADAIRSGLSREQIGDATGIDPWFVEQMFQIVAEERVLANAGTCGGVNRDVVSRAKTIGFSDGAISSLTGASPSQISALRDGGNIHPIYARVDTCAAEFEALSPYMYSTWGTECEANPTGRKKVMILGGGPNRIGQGIEFDYCCVHAAFGLRELGIETIMVNCNPETVSTDYDTSDRLYFEPLTFEDVIEIARIEKPYGVIVQFGGQTPLKLAVPLARANIRILGTSADAIDAAEDRERFEKILENLKLRRPRGHIAHGMSEAFKVAEDLGFPVMVRPSYVLGGRAMEVVHSRNDLARYLQAAFEAIEDAESRTILVDEFIENAIEVDVDAIADGKIAVIGGLMQHVEEAGVHSGDSSMVLPAHALPPDVLAKIRSATRSLALELGVVGLMNVQFAVRGSAVYVIEVNPRASRTIPFISKAIGVPLAKLAAKVMAGKSLEELGFIREIVPSYVAVKESVFPFAKFPGVDIILGPEMRSTGEVMGIGGTFPEAFSKALLAAGMRLPRKGRVFVSVRDDDKAAACEIALRLAQLGFEITATGGTAKALQHSGVSARRINKVTEGRPHAVDMLLNREIDLVINTTAGHKTVLDSYTIRRQTLLTGIPYFTTIAEAAAAVWAIETWQNRPFEVRSIQEYHQNTRLLSLTSSPR